MRVFACAAALFVVGGCNSSPQNPVDAAIVNAAVNQPIACKAGPECDAKWSCASAWIAQNSAFKIQTANELIIQTMGPLPYDATPAFTVTKVANASGDYEISLTGGCDNIFGCIPSIEQSRISFLAFVNAASGPPIIAHQGARLDAKFVPVAPGSGAALKLDADHGLIVADVLSGGLAAKAGLAKGDVLLTVDGAPVNTVADLTTALNAAAPHHKAKFELSRDGGQRSVIISF